jgi:hypothetical protein
LYKINKDYGLAIQALKEAIRMIERHGLLKHDIWKVKKAHIERQIDEINKLAK